MFVEVKEPIESMFSVNSFSYALRDASDVYEIAGVKRGLVVSWRGIDITGEGMGIGGPVVATGDCTWFALTATDYMRGDSITRRFVFDGVSIKHVGMLNIDRIYRALRGLLSPSYVKSEQFRPIYKYMMYFRTLFIDSKYEKREPIGYAEVEYSQRDSAICVRVSWSLKRRGTIIIANELSGKLFERAEVDGLEIRSSPWVRVRGRRATLFSDLLKVSMTVETPVETEFFFGRETVGRRLDWAGFDYFSAERSGKTEYTVRLSDHE